MQAIVFFASTEHVTMGMFKFYNFFKWYFQRSIEAVFPSSFKYQKVYLRLYNTHCRIEAIVLIIAQKYPGIVFEKQTKKWYVFYQNEWYGFQY